MCVELAERDVGFVRNGEASSKGSDQIGLQASKSCCVVYLCMATEQNFKRKFLSVLDLDASWVSISIQKITNTGSRRFYCLGVKGCRGNRAKRRLLLRQCMWNGRTEQSSSSSRSLACWPGSEKCRCVLHNFLLQKDSICSQIVNAIKGNSSVANSVCCNQAMSRQSTSLSGVCFSAYPDTVEGQETSDIKTIADCE